MESGEIDTGTYQSIFKPRSAKNMVKPVNFYFFSSNASRVSIVGPFNNWNPDANPMSRRIDGNWIGQVELHHGHHHYLLLVDDVPTLDPKALVVNFNEEGDKVSLIAVS